jgi:oxygen-dependent protoporphyrinogen oxidase
MRTVGIGAISLAFRRAAVQHPLDGLGLVIPNSEGRKIDAMMWSSSKWAGRAPEGTALIRVFFGGPHTRETVSYDDTAILQRVRAELKGILGITGEPLFWRIQRWQNVYPQYDLGHNQRVAAIEAALPADIALAGSAYHGVGVPDCIRLGRDAAKRVAATLPHPQETP